ncbi:hypothetical protein FHT86_003372 [Rhizobium sp. BK313]|uniref:hypothetical protein n=1 Tax=Rhizobium sp. BK313 TaxID=2587081 RepID=UPI00105C0AD6|nr:hypothetical protein [Rhizobium sp. BK313]MBB3455073.1 hypothetical protein [Rhizobium sp. BK313]
MFRLSKDCSANFAVLAVAAGWNEREAAAALVDLADNDMLGLIAIGEESAQPRLSFGVVDRSAREAACRIEKCYEAIMQLNGKRAA